MALLLQFDAANATGLLPSKGSCYCYYSVPQGSRCGKGQAQHCRLAGMILGAQHFPFPTPSCWDAHGSSSEVGCGVHLCVVFLGLCCWMLELLFLLGLAGSQAALPSSYMAGRWKVGLITPLGCCTALASPVCCGLP